MKVTKGAERILNNPFCILGLPCNAEKTAIIRAQEKLNKLSKIGAGKSYKTDYFSEYLPEIDRSAGIIQSAIVKIEEPVNKLFWFVDAKYIQQFNAENVKNEFIYTDDFERINYDCFLANYLFLLLEDPEFKQDEHWNKLFIYIESLLSCDIYIIKQIFSSHCKDDLDDRSCNAIASSVSKHILSPVEALADDLDSKSILSIVKIISKYSTVEFMDLSNSLLEHLVSEVERECSFVYNFIDSIGDIKDASEADVAEAAKMANKLSEMGKSIIEPLLITAANNRVVIDRVKDTFYTKMIKLADVLAFGKYFKNAYACATHAKKYAPSHKKSEIKDALRTLAELKAGEEAIEQAGGVRYLSYSDSLLVNSKDNAICFLAYQAFGGDAESQLILGNIYKTPTYERNAPINIAYDVSEGLKWIRKSANQGYAAGQLALGMCYVSGEGVAKDFSTADSWIQKAAAKGNAEAKALINDYRYASLKIQYKQIDLYSGNANSKSTYSNNTTSNNSGTNKSGMPGWLMFILFLAAFYFVAFIIGSIVNGG